MDNPSGSESGNENRSESPAGYSGTEGSQEPEGQGNKDLTTTEKEVHGEDEEEQLTEEDDGSYPVARTNYRGLPIYTVDADYPGEGAINKSKTHFWCYGLKMPNACFKAWMVEPYTTLSSQQGGNITTIIRAQRESNYEPLPRHGVVVRTVAPHPSAPEWVTQMKKRAVHAKSGTPQVSKAIPQLSKATSQPPKTTKPKENIDSSLTSIVGDEVKEKDGPVVIRLPKKNDKPKVIDSIQKKNGLGKDQDTEPNEGGEPEEHTELLSKTPFQAAAGEPTPTKGPEYKAKKKGKAAEKAISMLPGAPAQNTRSSKVVTMKDDAQNGTLASLPAQNMEQTQSNKRKGEDVKASRSSKKLKGDEKVDNADIPLLATIKEEPVIKTSGNPMPQDAVTTLVGSVTPGESKTVGKTLSAISRLLQLTHAMSSAEFQAVIKFLESTSKKLIDAKQEFLDCRGHPFTHDGTWATYVSQPDIKLPVFSGSLGGKYFVNGAGAYEISQNPKPIVSRVDYEGNEEIYIARGEDHVRFLKSGRCHAIMKDRDSGELYFEIEGRRIWL